MCFNVDGQLAADLIIGAVGQENWEVEINGKASHAGVAPEKGISATLVGGLALAEAQRDGWFGKVVKPDGQAAPAMSASSAARTASRPATRPTSSPTTSTSRARRAAPTRSSPRPSPRRIGRLHEGRGRGEGRRRRDGGGEVQRSALLPAVQAGGQRAGSRARQARGGVDRPQADDLFSNGGLDANWLDKHGVPTVTIGAGQYEIHTVKEYVDLPEFANGCRLAVALATLDG